MENQTKTDMNDMNEKLAKARKGNGKGRQTMEKQAKAMNLQKINGQEKNMERQTKSGKATKREKKNIKMKNTSPYGKDLE